MSKSFCSIYLHLIWKTKFGRGVLSGKLERYVHEGIRKIGRDENLAPIAVGSAFDHVHSLFRWHQSIAPADIVRKMKSKLAVQWNKQLQNGANNECRLEWQTGFGAVSIRKSDVEVVQAYIDNQKEHHRRDRVWAPFEKVSLSR